MLNSEIDLDEKTVKIKEKLSIYLNKFFGFQNDKIHNNESPSYWIMEIQSRIEITLPNCIIWKVNFVSLYFKLYHFKIQKYIMFGL